MIAGDPIYAAEKFAVAVHLLATGAGAIKSRLFDAFVELCPVSERDIPPELLADYRWIKEELTKREHCRRVAIEGRVVDLEGRIGATLRTMRIKKAIEISERICYMSTRLASLDIARATAS